MVAGKQQLYYTCTTTVKGASMSVGWLDRAMEGDVVAGKRAGVCLVEVASTISNLVQQNWKRIGVVVNA